MNFTEKDFIGIFENALPDGYCEHLIKEFEINQKLGLSETRIESEDAVAHKKNDNQMYCNGRNLRFNDFENKDTYSMFFDGLQECFNLYADKFSIIRNTRMSARDLKLQKTESGGGYHVWHNEQGNGVHSSRSLVFMLYLNTLPDDACGETEFLYQQRRIKPVENTMVIWPAAFTHAHRGNVVYGDNIKYIATGWFYNE